MGHFTFSSSGFSPLRQNVPMNVLVIGANGQDGSILCDLLEAQKINFVGLSRNTIKYPNETVEQSVDLSDFESAQNFLDQEKPSHIVHVAAVHAPSGSMFETGELMFDEMFKCHVQITENILKWQLSNLESKSIFALSSQMYSSQKQHALIKLDAPINPSSKYGETKAESWKLVKQYRSSHNVKTIGLILFNHTSSRSKPNFLFPELAIQFSNILNGGERVIKIRDTETFVDIFSAEELGVGIVNCIKSELVQDLIFSSGSYERISDIINKTAELLRISYNIELISTHPTDPVIPLHGDISKTIETLKWSPTATPAAILAKMVKEIGSDK